MRTAVVHDWLVTYAGAERVLEQILHLHPEADLFALVDFLSEDQRGFVLGKRAQTTFIQGLPLAKRRFRGYLPLFPRAIERLDLSSYDLVLSSSHAVAKGVRVRAGQPHLCYCHTPMRYAWDMQDEYLAGAGWKTLRRWAATPILNRLQGWDRQTASRVHAFAANSRFIAGRIMSCYGRESEVIHPPVDVDRFTTLGAGERDDFYVHISRLVPYKRADLIVDAFRAMPNRRLVVIGDGPCLRSLRQSAPRNVLMMGRQPDDVVEDHLRRARGMVFAGVEDFGIVLVESMACGTPVIAYGVGGALDSVVDGVTGTLFSQQTAASLIDAFRRFEETSFDPSAIRRHAEKFSIARFRDEFTAWVNRSLASGPL